MRTKKAPACSKERRGFFRGGLFGEQTGVCLEPEAEAYFKPKQTTMGEVNPTVTACPNGQTYLRGYIGKYFQKGYRLEGQTYRKPYAQTNSCVIVSKPEITVTANPKEPAQNIPDKVGTHDVHVTLNTYRSPMLLYTSGYTPEDGHRGHL